jgi:hypothetical protein
LRRDGRSAPPATAFSAKKFSCRELRRARAVARAQIRAIMQSRARDWRRVALR